MKQFIILLASVILGIFLVSLIVGDGGILDAMKSLWQNQLSMRNMQIVGP